MKKPAKTITAFAAAFIAMSMAGTVSAKADGLFGGFKLFGQKIEMAYAPQNDFFDDGRFDQFDSEEELHELNDAWLGMPAHDASGKLIGYVEDAYIGDDGEVSELLVSLNGTRYAVYVDGRHVELTDTEVGIDLPVDVIAGLEREENFQLVQR